MLTESMPANAATGCGGHAFCKIMRCVLSSWYLFESVKARSVLILREAGSTRKAGLAAFRASRLTTRQGRAQKQDTLSSVLRCIEVS